VPIADSPELTASVDEPQPVTATTSSSAKGSHNNKATLVVAIRLPNAWLRKWNVPFSILETE
jgi:hypothetical protein